MATVAARLRRLEQLDTRITKAEASAKADYAERLEIWQELVDEGVDRGDIATASGVSASAIGYQLHAKRKRQT